MKKALMTASMASMLDNFNRGNIKLLLEMGYEVTLAANFDGSEDSCPPSRIDEFVREMSERGCRLKQIDFTRKLGNLRGQIKSYRELKDLAREGYDLVHCNSPICAAMTRMVFRKSKARVIYTAHGFHFYKGAPLRNWLFYFPVEWICSHWTDTQITINREDYARACKYMSADSVEYIPGAGVDTGRFSPHSMSEKERAEKRRELEIPGGGFVLLSVGELQARKNQAIVIDALKDLKDRGIVYLIAGRGELEEEYRERIERAGLTGTVRLLGYRTDTAELCEAADCFIHTPVREGLGMAPLEAMASGLPLISSYVNGLKDYTKDGETGCCVDPRSAEDVKKAIIKMMDDAGFRARCGKHNAEAARAYSMENSMEAMRRIYEKKDESIALNNRETETTSVSF